jgi:hypothetical protein
VGTAEARLVWGEGETHDESCENGGGPLKCGSELRDAVGLISEPSSTGQGPWRKTEKLTELLNVSTGEIVDAVDPCHVCRG